ncbi:hypothetical protein G7046_g8421 [Stylonectria norvegica]|nr:hypothetical protein G7046_g8421 [Stylonectria norvegica]
MGVGAFLEPLIVVTLLFGGSYFNRTKDYDFFQGKVIGGTNHKRSDDLGKKRESSESLMSGWSASSPTLSAHEQPARRRRKVQFFGYTKIVSTPNTLVFKDRLVSRVLQKFPFLVEAWYWLNLYWVYQIGRAITALTLVEGTVNVARKHALQVIHLEQSLLIFWELPVQRWFLAHPALLHWVNRIYSFIHIPGTIFFLVMLYYITTTRKGRVAAGRARSDVVSAGPALYESRRRAMAVCNLIAFFVFTLWPCMPPRLLSDPNYEGEDAAEAKSYGFVDSVHSGTGESSVWTTNKFCNQYGEFWYLHLSSVLVAENRLTLANTVSAAMPSLHFGYSLLIGLTIATLPISGLRPGSWKRVVIVVCGLCYPTLILTCIVATANHFILDAVAGAIVCGIAWNANGILLNLCPFEDYFLWALRIHKPVHYTDPDTAVEPEFQSGAGLLSEEV